MRKSGAIVAGAIAALFATQARAATVLVSPGDSIQDAIDGAVAGDTVKILNGRYNQAVTLTKYVKLQGESKTGVILDGAGLGSAVVTIDTGLPAALVKNLTIAFSDEEGVLGADIGPANVESTVVKGCRGYGVFLDGTAALVVKSNTFRGIAAPAVWMDGASISVTSNKTYRSGGGLQTLTSGTAFLKSNASEDTAFGVHVEGFVVTSENNSARRGSGIGVNIICDTATILKGSQRSMYNRGVYCGAFGEGSTITSVSVKKTAGIGIEVVAGGATVSGCKVDLCATGIAATGAGSEVTLSSVRFGFLGIQVNGSAASVTGNTLKLLHDGAIFVQNSTDVFVDSNVVTEVGTYATLGAITVVGSWDGQVSRNVIGDVDVADAIYVEAHGYFRVGGFVGEYQGGNTITSATGAGIRMVNPSHVGQPAYPPVGLYGPRAAFNTVTSCGDLDTAAIASVGVQGNYIYLNTVTQSEGTGIEISTGTHDATIFGNLVVDSGTNGILLDGGFSQFCNDPTPWGCYGYGYFGPGYDNVVDSNIVANSGSEGIDNGAFATILVDNTVSGSGIHDFANGGSVNSSPSTGNTPQPSDWNAVPGPAQLDY